MKIMILIAMIIDPRKATDKIINQVFLRYVHNCRWNIVFLDITITTIKKLKWILVISS